MALNLAIPNRQIVLTKFGGLFTEADPRDFPAGSAVQAWDVDYQIAGIGIRPALQKAIGTFAPPVSGTSDWLYVTSSKLPGDLQQTIAQNSAGSLWAENIRGLDVPAIMSNFYSKILNNARMVSANIGEREYICFSDLEYGSDQPRQWDGVNLDRISQVGPGAGPSVPSTAGTVYTIASIDQPYTAKSIDSISWGSSINLYTATPSGTNLYFLSATGATTFLQGIYVNDYIYVTGAGNLEGINPNGTYKVVSTGYYTDTDGTRQYVQVTASQANSDFARGTAGGTLQKTLAVIQMTVPLPAQYSIVGSQITISGASVQQWNSTWTLVDTPNEGALNITSTSLTSNVATYDYSLISGNPPGWTSDHIYNVGAQIVDDNGSGHVWAVTTPGTSGSSSPTFPASPSAGATITDGTAPNQITWTYQSGATLPVTVFNTANGNGIFNVQGATIVNATSTTFTVDITNADVASAAESGEAISGAGSVLVIDPGTLTVSTGNPGEDPIYGSSTGGEVLPVSSQVAAGQRYAILMFLTRNGYLTPASPPVSFYTTGQSTSFKFSDLAIGPPNVIARVVAITAANAGVGGPYYYIPEDIVIPASTTTLGLTTTVTKTVVDDNTSTESPTFTITDDVLLSSVDVTAAGNNRLQVRELGECMKCVQFLGRVFYIGERVKNDQLINMTFDGGAISSKPAGWTIDSPLTDFVSLVTSQVFGQSLYIDNTSGSTINPFGTALVDIQSLHQTAYTTAAESPIIQPNTQYNFRVTAMIPSGSTSGGLTIELYSATAGSAWGYDVPFTSFNSSGLTEVIGQLNNPLWETVPSDLELRVYPYNFADAADLTVDRIELYPAQTPYYKQQVAVSYADDFESIDAVTGVIDISQYTSEPLRNVTNFVENELYISSSTHTFAPSPNDTEPDGWTLKEISDLCGCYGPLAEDEGPEYRIKADTHGVWVFDGGNHIKISQEIQKLWNLVYQPSAKSIWVRNDMYQKRIYIGVPMMTPNGYLPNAAVNATPATPNVILMCSYLGEINGRSIAEGDPVHVSMFTGSLLWRDMERKWAIWQIPSPYGSFIKRVDGSREMWLGGTGTGQIYRLAEHEEAQITSFSITSNVVTLNCYNTFQLGQKVTIFGLSTGTYLNGQALTITATGYSSFTADFTHADVTSTSDTGIATNTTDDGAVIDESYMPYGFSDNKDEQTLQLGAVRKLYDYASMTIEGGGAFNMTSYPETPFTNYASVQPNINLENPAEYDINMPWNVTGNRCFFKFHVDGNLGSYYNLRKVIMACQPDPMFPVRGWNA